MMDGTSRLDPLVYFMHPHVEVGFVLCKCPGK